MKSLHPFSLSAWLLAGALFSLVASASAAQRVASERSKAAPVTVAPAWRAASFPAAKVSRLQYQEMSAARILKLEKLNAARRMKPMQIGIARVASGEGAARALPALQWMPVRNGGSVARMEITSPVALGLRVGLQVDGLDPRAELRFAGSAAPSRVVAMMTGEEIRKLADAKNIFWTPSTDGEKQFIEVYLPAGVPHSGTRLHAPQLSHLLANSLDDFKILTKDSKVSEACNVDTVCRVGELGANFVSAKNAVARMVFTQDGGSYLCTGTLLADTVTTSQIPYFYSANHCIANQAVASTLNTFWKYESTGCGNGILGANNQLTGGATYLYSNAIQFDSQDNYLGGTDALLMRLNNPAPAGAEFAGWDSTALPASSSVIGIHHPAGDMKKVSSGKTRTGLSGLLQAGWLIGSTEGGSSGSGLFTADAGGYRLRGGLYGGSAECSNSGSLSNEGNADYYSRFDVVFPDIRQWLSPTPTNVPPVANFGFSVNDRTVTFTDTSSDSDGSIAARSWSFGDGTTSTAANAVKAYASYGTYNVTLTVTDNGSLSRSITRSVRVAGRTRVNGSQPRVPGRSAATTPAAARMPANKASPRVPVRMRIHQP